MLKHRDDMLVMYNGLENPTSCDKTYKSDLGGQKLAGRASCDGSGGSKFPGVASTTPSVVARFTLITYECGIAQQPRQRDGSP
jgi:hypothetical protein